MEIRKRRVILPGKIYQCDLLVGLVVCINRIAHQARLVLISLALD